VRIFLSYASERRAAAEPIALALRGRGHAVFFDKDDLPGAESYDAQIETAVGESDLMIFLISPESVEPGRYTLTELAFARHRWRSARGRVLPVLIAPTPLERTPAYLTSVQILKPEGNAAAEVASFVDGIIPVAKVEHALPLAAALGVASGMVSGGVDLFAPLKPFRLEFASLQTEASVADVVVKRLFLVGGEFCHAPYVFALAIAALLLIWDRTRFPRLLWVLPIILAAWSGAYHLADGVINPRGSDVPQLGLLLSTECLSYGEAEEDNVQPPTLRQDLSPDKRALCEELQKYETQLRPLYARTQAYLFTFAGLGAGFLGALLMMLGLGRLSPRLRHLEAVVLSVFAGSLAGALLNTKVPAALGFKETLLPLFVLWQAAVAMAIAWQFTKPGR
jgi:hypothetical protein